MFEYQKGNTLTKSKNEFEIWKTFLGDYIIGIEWNQTNEKLAVIDASGRVNVYNSIDGNLLSSFIAHNKNAMSIRSSAKDDKFVTTGQDGFIRIWSFNSTKPIKEIKSNAQWVNFSEWSSDGKYFAVSEGNIMRVFTDTGLEVFSSIEHESTISGIQWGKNNKHIATSCYGGVRIFDVEAKICMQFLEWKNSMLSLSWSPDGLFIGCGTQDSRIHFFPLPYQYGSDFEMNGYKGKVKILDWTYDARYFLSNCWDDLVIWKFAGVAPQGQVPISCIGHLSKITSASFQNKSYCLVSGDEDGIILFHDPELGEKHIVGVKLMAEISSLKWSGNDLYLAAGTAMGELVIMESPV
jgi:WD40 repeat protein